MEEIDNIIWYLLRGLFIIKYIFNGCFFDEDVYWKMCWNYYGFVYMRRLCIYVLIFKCYVLICLFEEIYCVDLIKFFLGNNCEVK